MATTFILRAVFVTLSTVVNFVEAQDSTFRITQLYSNLDGNVQFIELTESAGLNGQHRLKGLTLTTTQHGRVKRFTFPRDLATDQTAHMAITVSVAVNVPVSVIAHEHLADVWGLPSRFVPTEQGTVDFAGIDRMSYASLPTDGSNALYRDGSVREATVVANSRCQRPCAARLPVEYRFAIALEYHHEALDHYFVSAAAADIDALESGRIPGWTSTGQSFPVNTQRFGDLDRPVCRFYIPPDLGNSHFHSSSPEECEAVRARYPTFVLETQAAFYVEVPGPGGACPPDDGSGAYAVPVYRLWNRRPDSNHRYTSSVEIRNAMLQRGYVSEGVFMCYWTSVWDY